MGVSEHGIHDRYRVWIPGLPPRGNDEVRVSLSGDD
jgi:hypothetical protein